MHTWDIIKNDPPAKADHITKRQHHIPRMLLKRFANSDDKVFRLEKNSKNICCLNIKDAAVKSHLYSIHYDDGKDDSIERKFSVIEDKINNLLNQILENPEEITAKNYIDLVDFVVIMKLRSPVIVELAKNMSVKQPEISAIKKLHKKKKINNQITSQLISDLKHIKGFRYADSFEGLYVMEVIKLLHNFDVFFYHTDNDDIPLMIGDNYAVYEPMGDIKTQEKIYGHKLWYKLNMLVHCPLSSRACLTFIPKINKENVDTWNYKIGRDLLTKKQIQNINQLTLKVNKYIYCKSSDLLKF